MGLLFINLKGSVPLKEKNKIVIGLLCFSLCGVLLLTRPFFQELLNIITKVYGPSKVSKIQSSKSTQSKDRHLTHILMLSSVLAKN